MAARIKRLVQRFFIFGLAFLLFSVIIDAGLLAIYEFESHAYYMNSLLWQVNKPSYTPILSRLQKRADRFAFCENISPPELFISDLDSSIGAKTGIRSALGAALSVRPYIVFNSDHFELLEKWGVLEDVLAHEVGHHLWESTIYVRLYDDVRKILGWSAEDREEMATIFGRAAWRRCFGESPLN